MLYSLKNSLFILSLLGTLVVFQACESEGCTDPNGENYDADADVDDGTCTYARTKLIGTYGVGESCDGGAARSYLVKIEEATATNAIDIINLERNVTVTGIVSGNTIMIDDTFVDAGQTLSMKGDGTYSDSNGNEEINIEYTITGTVNGQIATSTCIAVWGKT